MIWNEERFWSKVVKCEDGCWKWKGTLLKGYGIHTEKGRRGYSHRVAWEMRYFKLPGDLCIDHLCRVKSCVNPDHLDVVTWAENGRQAQQALKAEHLAAKQPAAKSVECPAVDERALPDSPGARAYFERRKVEIDGHWVIRSRQKRGTPALLIDGKLWLSHHLAYT